MIAFITTMAVPGLLFSSRGSAVDIGSLLRLCKPGRCLFVSDGFHTDCAELTVIIDSFTVLKHRFPINGCFASNGIPLAATSVLHDLIVTTRSCVTCGIIERCT